MNLKRTLIPVLASVAALALPATCAAANGAPHPGKWTTTGGGRFTVSSDDKSISGFHVSGRGCDLKPISVTGKQTLHVITEGGGANWAVGTADPTRKNPKDVSGVVGQKVTIHSGGQTIQGRLEIVFAIGGFARDNDGDLLVRGCHIPFYAHP